MERIPITIKGLKKIQEEQQQLIKVDRPKIINDISTARAHGDLKENAEYHAAKEKQGWIEGRIQRINYILAQADAIEPSTIKSNRVQFGATVKYENVDTEEVFKWQIVGEEETDTKNCIISYKSPIARALIGKEAGDEVIIKTPKGDIEVEILDVNYF